MRTSFKTTWMLFLLTAIYVFNVIDRQILSILAEPIRKDLMLSDTQIALLTGLVFALFYGVSAIPLAWLADRFGRIRIVALSCAIWSLCSAAGGFAASFAQLAAARVGVAVGEAGGTAPSHSLIAESFPPHQRATALGIFSLGVPIGAFLGFMLCAWLAENYGWRVAIMTVSLPGVMFAALLFLTVREPTTTAPHQDAQSFGVGVRDFFQSPVLRSTVIAASVAMLVAQSIAAWLPAYLMRVHDMRLGEIGTYYGATNALAGAIGIFVGGALSDKLGKHARRYYALVPAFCCLLSAPFLAAGLVVDSWQAAMPLCLIGFMLISTFIAPALAIVQQEAKSHQRGIFASLFMLTTGSIAAGGGPLLVGTVSDLTQPYYGLESLGLGLAALVPLMVLSGALYHRLSKNLATNPLSTLSVTARAGPP